MNSFKDDEASRLKRVNVLASFIVELRDEQIKILTKLAKEMEKQEPKASREMDIIKIMQIV